MALFPVFRSRAKWLLHCVLVILNFALAASPYLILNTFEFGHPLKTGYDFWVPWFTEKQMLFSVHNVPSQLAMIWSEVTASWDQFRVANLFGTGTYVVPTFVLLSVVGLAFLQFRRFEISALLAGTVFFIATATYSFDDGRFYMPILFLLVALAVLPAEWAIRSFKSRYSFLAVSVIRLNQASNPRRAVLKHGTLFIMRTITESRPGTKRRTNSFAPFGTHLALFCPMSNPPY